MMLSDESLIFEPRSNIIILNPQSIFYHGLKYVLRLLPNACEVREFFIDNLLVRIHFTIVIIRWTGLAPWEFEFPFPGRLTSTFLKSF